MTKEALELALEALEEPKEHFAKHRRLEAITAIKEALAQEQEPVTYSGNGTAGREADARPTGFFFQMPKPMTQPEQEPVAWMDKDGDVLSASIVDGKGLRNIPLYTTPPQRTWVGLTDEEVKDIVWNLPYEPSQEHIRAIEAKLKEKNT